MKLGHAHLEVSNLDRSIAFYRDILGLRVTERLAGFAFLSAGEAHHDLALQERAGATPAPAEALGLYHLAFEIDSESELRLFEADLRERGIAATAVDHGVSWALYFSDPDDHGVEVFMDRRSETRKSTWSGRSRPLDLTREFGDPPTGQAALAACQFGEEARKAS